MVILLFLRDKPGGTHPLCLAKATSPFQIPPPDVAGRSSALSHMLQLKTHLSRGSWPSWVRGLCALESQRPWTSCMSCLPCCSSTGQYQTEQTKPLPGFYSWGFNTGQVFPVMDTRHKQGPSKEESAQGKVLAWNQLPSWRFCNEQWIFPFLLIHKKSL